MAADEIRNLRYCHAVLRRRIANQDDGLPYWRMNLRLATFFLKVYDAEFDRANWHYDDVLSDTEQKHILRTHTLLQRPTTDRPGYPKLTKELERNLRRRIARYLASL
jgi:hypothetical protein